MGCWAHLRGVVLPFDHKPFQVSFYFNLPFYHSIRMLQLCMFSVLFSSIGSHTNYSTKSMRNKGGYEVIKKAIEKPGLRHIGQIAASVEGNGQRVAADTKHLTLILSNGVLLIVGLPFMFNNEQYAL